MAIPTTGLFSISSGEAHRAGEGAAQIAGEVAIAVVGQAVVEALGFVGHRRPPNVRLGRCRCGTARRGAPQTPQTIPPLSFSPCPRSRAAW